MTDLNDIRWSCGDARCYESVCGFSAMQERGEIRRGGDEVRKQGGRGNILILKIRIVNGVRLLQKNAMKNEK